MKVSLESSFTMITYSMLKATLYRRKCKYSDICKADRSFEAYSIEQEPKKSKVLTSRKSTSSCNAEVAFTLGIPGACRREELYSKMIITFLILIVKDFAQKRLFWNYTTNMFVFVHKSCLLELYCKYVCLRLQKVLVK